MHVSITNPKQLNSIKWEEVATERGNVKHKLLTDKVYITIHHSKLKSENFIKLRIYIGRDILDLFKLKNKNILSVQISPDRKLIKLNPSISGMSYQLVMPGEKKTAYINCRLRGNFKYKEQRINKEVEFELFDNKTIIVNMSNYLIGE